jgi:predicted dienelactone hydrolase
MAPRLFKDISQEYLEGVIDDLNDSDFKQMNKSYRDNRIKAVFAMAPGIAEKNTTMFNKEGLAKNAVPTFFVVGEDDDVQDVQSLAKYISGSVINILPGHVSHWTLLNEGTQEGKKLNAFITVDDESINRAAIHQQIGSMALQFFNNTLFQ